MYEYRPSREIYVTFAKPTFSRSTPGTPIPLTLDFRLCVCEQLTSVLVRSGPMQPNICAGIYLAGLLSYMLVASLLAFFM